MSAYEQYLDSLQKEDHGKSQLVSSLSEAATANPDEFARMRQLSKAASISIDAVPDYKEEAQQAKYLGEVGIGRLWRDAPKTSAFLSNPDNAKLAKDDVEKLGGLERFGRQFFGSAAENVGRAVHGFGELANVAQRSLAGWAGLLLPTPRSGGSVTLDSLAGPMLGDDWRDIGKTAMQYYRENVLLPANRQTFGDQVVGGLGQVASQIALLPIDRGASLWAQGASIMAEKVEPDAATQWKKDLAVLGGSAVTGVTEKFALDRLLGPLAVPIKNQLGAALARIGIGAAAEGGQEFTESILHDALQQQLTNPNQKIDIGQAGQEAGVGATVGGIVRTVVEGALHVKRRGQQQMREADTAEQNAAALADLAKLANESKLRTRAPEVFAEFFRDAFNGSPISHVFISAQTLAQSGKASELAAASPAIGEQLQLALETGGDVAIPIDEFATTLAPVADSLLDHLKTAPGGLTRAEAQQFAKSSIGGVTPDEINRLATEQARDLGHAEEVRQIEQTIGEQLDKAGRFSPTVNRAYAALPTAFFDTMAQRLAVSPSALWAAYGVNVTAESVTGPILTQDEKAGFVPREFTQDGKALIGLFKGANTSSFLHESGHWFLESYADMARAHPALKNDMQVMLDWLGVDSLDTWHGMSLEQKRAHHEQFARGVEAYLYEGKAPSIQLQGLFQRFSAWLARVYRSLRDLDVELSPEIRGVLDRMLATDAHIQEAERSRALVPMFTSETQAAEFGIDWREYQAIDVAASDEALAQMQARSQRDMAYTSRLREETVRKLNKDAADKRKAMRREVEAEVSAQPIYAAMRFLKHGEVRNGAEEIKATAGHRLSLPAVREMYPDGALDTVDYKRLGFGKYGMLAKDGLHPDIVAEMFGFSSGDELVRRIAAAEAPKAEIEALTDVRMLEQYGDLSSPEAIAKAADEAIHNDVRLRFLATELAGLQKALGSSAALTKMAKEYAAGLVSNTRLKELRPAQFAAADARAGKAADAALRKGDTAEAVRQKRYQVINHAATRAAYDAQDEADKTVGFFRAVADAKADQLKNRNVDLVNAARAILAEYGVGMRGKRPREYMETVKAYDPELYATLEPMLIEAEQDARPLDQLTIGELRALRDNIESLWYLARREKQVEVDGQLVDRQQITDALTARLAALGIPSEIPGEGRAVTEGEKKARFLMGARAALRRVEGWADRMDGGQMSGAFRRFIFQPISEAANEYRADAGRYLKQYRDLVKAIEPTLKPGRIAAPELGYTFGYSKGDAGKAELLHAILHTGNESNMRKLLLGRGWASERADGGLDTSRWQAFMQRMIREGTLTKADFDFAQGVWDLLEETKPLAQKTHRQVFGRYFDEVTADEFVIAFKDGTRQTYRGGYVPAIYDTFEVQDAAINSELDAVNQANAFMFPATARGFTKGRVDYNKPLALDLRLLPQHIDKVLLFSHLEPRVRDVMRTLRSKGFSSTLNRYDPVAYTDLLLPWLNRAAKQTVETPATGWGGKLGDRVFRQLRSRSGMAAMFANVTNALQQITGLSLAALKVKPHYLKAATWRYLRAPSKLAGSVAEASTFMANRQNNEVMQMRSEIEQLLINPNAYEKAQGWTTKHAYFLQAALQNVVDTITWSAAYDQAVASGEDHRAAVRAADAAVRQTQGSLQPEDISRFESGTAFARLFTQFQSYFNMQANLLGTEFAKVAQGVGLREGAGRLFYVFLLGFLVPAWFSEAIVQAMRGGPADDEDDGYLDEFLAAFFGAPLRNAAAMVPIAGQSAVLIANSFNRKPYDDRMSTAPAVSMIESAASAPHSVYKAIAEDGSQKRAIRDTLTLVSITTGIPVAALGKPLGYAADISQGKVEPTGPLDAVRGAVSGAASPDSKR